MTTYIYIFGCSSYSFKLIITSITFIIVIITYCYYYYYCYYYCYFIGFIVSSISQVAVSVPVSTELFRGAVAQAKCGEDLAHGAVCCVEESQALASAEVPELVAKLMEVLGEEAKKRRRFQERRA